MELAGRKVPIVWHGRRAKAFVPTRLGDRHLTLDSHATRATAVAAAEVGFAASGLEADYEPLARLLLRAEGVASSYIEGVRAPVADVVMAEEMPTSDAAAAWVAANLAALVAAVAQAMTGELSVDQLCEWHRTLMTGSPTPARYVGVIRDEQGWIGGTDPTNAALVTPPPDMLGPLLQDLVAYINRTDVDPIAQAAIAHVQFEIVHPFADGNGRIGRLLVSWILTRRLQLVVPPPVSVAMAADVGGYLSGLTRLPDGRPQRMGALVRRGDRPGFPGPDGPHSSGRRTRVKVARPTRRQSTETGCRSVASAGPAPSTPHADQPRRRPRVRALGQGGDRRPEDAGERWRAH